MTIKPAGSPLSVSDVDAELGISNSNRSLDFLNGYVKPAQRPSSPNMNAFYSKTYFKNTAEGNCNNGGENNCNCDTGSGGRCHNCYNCAAVNCVNCDSQAWLQNNCNCACTYNCVNNVACFNQNCACSKIICTRLYQNGLMDRHIFMADQAYGEWLKKHDRVVYRGYFRWARVVASWMDGNGPTYMPWIRDVEKRNQKQKEFIMYLAYAIGTPWSQHMAYLMGAIKHDNTAGRILMNIGRPVCRIAYYMPKSKGTNTVMAMFMVSLFVTSLFVATRGERIVNFFKKSRFFGKLVKN